MSTAPELVPLDEIREELLEVESAEDRVEILVELGDTLDDFPKSSCVEENRVVGCQSMVWLTHQTEEGRIQLQATSDAPMVKGLIAILMSAFSNHAPREILDFDIEQFFTDIHLQSFLSPLRSNGLRSIVKRIQEIATLEAAKLGDISTISAVIGSRGRSDLSHFGTRDILDSRKDFPILDQIHSCGEHVAYLDNAASSQRPQQVIDAMGVLYETHYSNVHRAGHEMANETTTKMEAAREAVRRFINAESTDEVIFTAGTTASINTVARAWGDAHVHSGDEILLSEMEHHSNIVPWQQLAARTGAKIRWLPIRDDFHLDMDALDGLLTSRTRIISILAVSNVLGTINPVKALVERGHEVGATVLIDAAQAIPHGGVDVQDWDADFVVFSGHKMLGPSGIGVLYGKRRVLESMPAFLGGGNMIKTVTFDGYTDADLPHRFEAGTAPIAEAIGMLPAVEYLESIGGDAILEHEQVLLRHAMKRLESVRGLHVFGPAISDKSGVISFTIDGISSQQVAELLDARGIAVRVGHHCAMPLHEKLKVAATCRASFYLYNTLDEVDRFVDGLLAIVDRFVK
jgi:cysteine desulfurase/selenocysteine lyase